LSSLAKPILRVVDVLAVPEVKVVRAVTGEGLTVGWQARCTSSAPLPFFIWQKKMWVTLVDKATRVTHVSVLPNVKQNSCGLKLMKKAIAEETSHRSKSYCLAMPVAHHGVWSDERCCHGHEQSTGGRVPENS
jgi:hypothetical protein